jgi:hypothetical protein
LQQRQQGARHGRREERTGGAPVGGNLPCRRRFAIQRLEAQAGGAFDVGQAGGAGRRRHAPHAGQLVAKHDAGRPAAEFLFAQQRAQGVGDGVERMFGRRRDRLLGDQRQRIAAPAADALQPDRACRRVDAQGVADCSTHARSPV